jgi:hypothetical protein
MRETTESAPVIRSMVLVFVPECQQFEQRVDRELQQWQRQQQQ